VECPGDAELQLYGLIEPENTNGESFGDRRLEEVVCENQYHPSSELTLPRRTVLGCGTLLLDIGLPTLNGIEAARRIREVSPTSKILFASENRSVDVAEEALSTGAVGYVVKSDAASELLPAVEAVLQGKRFVRTSVRRDTTWIFCAGPLLVAFRMRWTASIYQQICSEHSAV
jgi:DNA-binding response OmpR family regulator